MYGGSGVEPAGLASGLRRVETGIEWCLGRIMGFGLDQRADCSLFYEGMVFIYLNR
jgi:hypothetical protein